MVFSWLGQLVPVFWLVEWISSPKGSTVSSSRFGLSVRSACLWAVLLAPQWWAHLFLQPRRGGPLSIPSLHAPPVPGIFAGASVPWSRSARYLGSSSEAQTQLGLHFVPFPGSSNSGDQVLGECGCCDLLWFVCSLRKVGCLAGGVGTRGAPR